MSSDLPRQDGLPDECPFPCDLCPSPGDCEDCLDYLEWPGAVPAHPMPPWTPRVRASPARTHQLEEARRRLGMGRRVGHRLAVVEDSDDPATAADELPDEAWGAVDLIARDRRGRRFPPFARLTWEEPMARDLYRRHGQHLPEWTWTSRTEVPPVTPG